MKSIYKCNLIAFYTILYREITRVFRIWLQTIIPPIITTGLYFIIFGNLIGSHIKAIQGVTYIQYIIPGLVIMSVITNSFTNVVSSFFGVKFQRNIEEMLIAPMSIHTMLLGFICGGLIRGILVGSMVCFVATCFTKVVCNNILLTIIVAMLTAILFSLAGLLNGIFSKKFDDTTIIPTFIITPLIYLGGVFYSIELLPDFWKNFTLLNPIFYIVNVFRYSMLGITDVSVYSAIIMICLLIVGLYLVNWWLLLYSYRVKE